MNNSEEEEVKTIKIVQDSSPVSEKVMCYICRASLMSQYLVRHMKSGHSDDYKNSENNDRDASRVLLKIRRMCILHMNLVTWIPSVTNCDINPPKVKIFILYLR